MVNFNTSYIFTAVDKVSGVTKHISNSLDNVNKSVTKANKGSKSFSDRLEALSKRSSLLNNEVLRLATGYLSLRGAMDFGKSLINTQVQLQNIQAGLLAVTGSQQKATEEFNFARKAANQIGVSFSDIILPYTKFIASSKLTEEQNRKVFVSFNKLSRVFGLTGDQTAGIFRALEQMQSKGKVMSEELKLQLGDRLPGALQIFSEASGLSTEKFVELMEQGKLGAGLITRVADVIEKKYGEASITASKTLGAEIARLQSAFFFLKMEMGGGVFSDVAIKSVIWLRENIGLVKQAVIGLVAIFGVMALMQIPIMFVSMGAKIALATIKFAKFAKLITLFSIAHPFVFIIAGLATLLLSFETTRKVIWKGLLFIKNIAVTVGKAIGKVFSFVFGDMLNYLKQAFSFVKKIGEMIGLIKKEKGDISVQPGQNISMFGGVDMGSAINKLSTPSKTTNILGLEGIIDIRGAPAGSKASFSAFPASNANLGVNMSFAPGGI